MTSATQLKFSSDFSGPVTVSRWERSFPPLRTIEGAQLYPITKNSNFSFETGAKSPPGGTWQHNRTIYYEKKCIQVQTKEYVK